MDGQARQDEGRQAVVIVTGASSGLGAAFAALLDRTLPREVSLWLVARDRERLARFAAGLEREPRLLALDLTDQAALEDLSADLAGQNPLVQLLINNAGEGCAGPFEAQDLLAHQSLCDLNVRAQLLMTSLALPYMDRGSFLVFTSSVAAFLPQPGFASYAASKAFILSFGRALREELRERGIGVTVTCPNPMLTSFFSEDQKEALLNSYKRLGLEDPAQVAEKTLTAVRRGRGLVVTSPAGKMIRLAARLLPTGLLIRMIKWR